MPAWTPLSWKLTRTSPETVQMVVEDHGKGFAAVQKPSQEAYGGLGIYRIQQRIEAFGGYMDIRSEPGKGTRIVMIAPAPVRQPKVLRNSAQGRQAPQSSFDALPIKGRLNIRRQSRRQFRMADLVGHVRKSTRAGFNRGRQSLIHIEMRRVRRVPQGSQDQQIQPSKQFPLAAGISEQSVQ